jgi:hypothetical protein
MLKFRNFFRVLVSPALFKKICFQLASIIAAMTSQKNTADYPTTPLRNNLMYRYSTHLSLFLRKWHNKFVLNTITKVVVSFVSFTFISMLIFVTS